MFSHGLTRTNTDNSSCAHARRMVVPGKDVAARVRAATYPRRLSSAIGGKIDMTEETEKLGAWSGEGGAGSEEGDGGQ